MKKTIVKDRIERGQSPSEARAGMDLKDMDISPNPMSPDARSGSEQ